MGIAEDKAELRAFVRLTRSARSSLDAERASEAFDEFLTVLADQFGWSRVAAFIPTATEPPIAHGLNRLVDNGVAVIVPVSSDNGLLEWIELTTDSIFDTREDAMRMPVPVSGERVAPGELDAVLVPAAAVDRTGNRLGWGKGYYDRFLEGVPGTPLVVAVVFDSDVVVSVPTESHDKSVSAIVTESEITFTQ